MSKYYATGYTYQELKSMHPNVSLKGDSEMNSSYIEEKGWPQIHGEPSTVIFTTQSGPIKEFGVNGGQIDDVIEWVKEKIEGFQVAFPCRENAMVITKLDEALLWLVKRKLDREKRNVEGQNKL